MGHSGKSHALKGEKDMYFVFLKHYHEATPKVKLDTIHAE